MTSGHYFSFKIIIIIGTVCQHSMAMPTLIDDLNLEGNSIKERSIDFQPDILTEPSLSSFDPKDNIVVLIERIYVSDSCDSKGDKFSLLGRSSSRRKRHASLFNTKRLSSLPRQLPLGSTVDIQTLLDNIAAATKNHQQEIGSHAFAQASVSDPGKDESDGTGPFPSAVEKQKENLEINAAENDELPLQFTPDQPIASPVEPSKQNPAESPLVENKNSPEEADEPQVTSTSGSSSEDDTEKGSELFEVEGNNVKPSPALPDEDAEDLKNLLEHIHPDEEGKVEITSELIHEMPLYMRSRYAESLNRQNEMIS